MTAEAAPARPRTVLDRFYFVGVAVKGIDGAIELVVGLLLWIAPRSAHALLSAIAAELNEQHASAIRFAADYVARLDSQLAHSGLIFLIVFLLIHGVVKLALVYCLLRRFHRVYPYAIAVLIAFLAYQIYALITSPTISMALFSILDAVIVVLVYREYRELSPRKKPTTSEG